MARSRFTLIRLGFSHWPLVTCRSKHIGHRIAGFPLVSKNYASADVTSVRVKSSPLNNNGSFTAFASA
jgi:hypothetical protein